MKSVVSKCGVSDENKGVLLMECQCLCKRDQFNLYMLPRVVLRHRLDLIDDDVYQKELY